MGIKRRMRKAAWVLGLASRSKAAAAVAFLEGDPVRVRDVYSDTQQQQDPQLSSYSLLLTPARLEARFWTSVKVLRVLDMVGLFNSVMLNAMLVRKFGWGQDKPDMLWHFLPVLLYLTAGILQLAVLVVRPELHQRSRFAINLANRLVKAVTVTWAAVNMSQADVMNQFTGILNSVPHVAAGGDHSAATYMKILRTVASLPLLWVSHAVNFMLPFWLLLPLQLCTLFAVSNVVPSIVCVLKMQPAHILHPAAVIATHVHGVVKCLVALAVPMPLHWPWASTGAAPTAAADLLTKDLLMLVATTFTMILVTIPCVLAYHVELTWKEDFLASCRRSAPDRSASSSSLTPRAKQSRYASPLWATLDIVCMMLLLSETIVQAAPAVQCDAHIGT